MTSGGKRFGAGRKRGCSSRGMVLVSWRIPGRFFNAIEDYRKSNTVYVTWKPPTFVATLRERLFNSNTKMPRAVGRLPRKIPKVYLNQPSRLYVMRVPVVLAKFLSRVAREFGISRSELINRILWRSRRRIVESFFRPQDRNRQYSF